MTDKLVDRFGRRVDYLRMSVTDRCDFRCVYCMAEEMEFLPRSQVLTLEEFAFIGRAFIELGVRKIRVTGGEPMVKRDVMKLLNQLGQLKHLRELTLTTNGARLDRFAAPLRAAGVKRINVSLDTLNPDKFRKITRIGDLSKVLTGIKAAKAQQFPRIKINAVILKGCNDEEILGLLEFALENEFDISYIEEMPLGLIDEHNRALAFCSSQEVRGRIGSQYQLIPTNEQTGGPSRYWRIDGYPSRVGFISPHSENFCGTCNRIRLISNGRLLLCLGNEHSVDLRAVVRAHPGDMSRLKKAIIEAMTIKPERHYFDINNEPQILRFMNATGG